jgi:pimeloyl-ACP methyl ester carboxylesterase
VRARDLDVARHGEGPRVVLVHGSVVGAQRTWRRQLELADRWTLVLPNRPGFAGSPALARGDFAAEAPLIAGRGHTIPATGEPYNALLHSFLAEHQR